MTQKETVANNHDGLKRRMSSRHLTMISLGGVIGNRFVRELNDSRGRTARLSRVRGLLPVYCVMLCLGELSVAMPYAGSSHLYAEKFIGPGTVYCRCALLAQLGGCAGF